MRIPQDVATDVTIVARFAVTCALSEPKSEGSCRGSVLFTAPDGTARTRACAPVRFRACSANINRPLQQMGPSSP